METTTQVNSVAEIALTAGRVYGDPFREAEVTIEIEGDAGRFTVPAFWRGGRDYAFRFAAPQPGRYAWRSHANQPDDEGLHGRGGTILVTREGETSLLREHGRLRPSSCRRFLEHTDGTPFLWCGDTWWNGFTDRLDWPDGFQRLTRDRQEKGFNVIQLVAGPLPDFDGALNAFDQQQANQKGLPWLPGWECINPGFYDLVDERVQYLVDQDIVPCLVGMWAYHLPYMGMDNARLHWRYLLARYGAYPVVWAVAGETTMPTYSVMFNAEKATNERVSSTLKDGWTELTRYVRETDPFGSVITTHPASLTHSRRQLHDESLLDLNMAQLSHLGPNALEQSFEILRQVFEDRPWMPTLVGETHYEGIMGSSWSDCQRYAFWASMTMGCCGFTYGAHGIWNMNSRSAPYRGDSGNWGGGYWQDAMHYAGSRHVGQSARFLAGLPWHRCKPDPLSAELAGERIASLSMSIPGELRIAYLPSNAMPARLRGLLGSEWNACVPLIDPLGFENVTFYDPQTDLCLQQEIGGAGDRPPLCKPSFADWVLVLHNNR